MNQELGFALIAIAAASLIAIPVAHILDNSSARHPTNSTVPPRPTPARKVWK